MIRDNSETTIEYVRPFSILDRISSFSKLISYKWLIVFVMINLLIVIPELTLRLLNFNYGPGVSYGNLSPKFTKYFVPDDKLMWRYPVNEPGVNSYGFYGPEIISPKPDNVVRIVFFGDSCAEQNYASILEQKLNENCTDPNIKFECLVFAIAGYSSFQGRILADKYAKTIEADLAFICYGWNDHWLSFNNISDKQYVKEKNHTLNYLNNHSKILQLARKLTAPLFKKDKNNLSNIVRVPIENYHDNICYMTNELENSGATSILLTAPTSYYTSGVSDHIIKSRLAIDKNSVISKHVEYNEVIRNIADKQKIYLLDIENLVNQLKNPDSLFLNDGIHFSSSGLEFMALLLHIYLVENKLI